MFQLLQAGVLEKAGHRKAVIDRTIILLFAELGVVGFGGLEQSRASCDR